MKILVAVDFSDITDKVLSHAARLAEATRGALVLMHIAEPAPDHIAYDMDPGTPYAIDPAELRDGLAKRFHQEHKALQDHAEALRQRGIECKALMVQGETVDMLLAEADKMQVDFIVAGSHGKGLLGQLLLGSTSEKLLRNSRLPVHIIPAAE